MMVVLTSLTVIVISVLAVVYIYFRKQYNYWKDRNIPFEVPTFPFGNLRQSTPKNIGVLLSDLYRKSRKERFYGIWLLHKPVLLINDLDLVKDILVKDFMSFQDHGVYHDEKVDPLSANLFAIEGAKWRNIRAKLTPTFTSGKMKMMFPLVKACAEEFKGVLEKHAEKEDSVEIKDLVARFTTDVIASCAFGIEANSLKNPDNMFRVMGRKLFEPSWEILLRNSGAFLFPELAKFLKLRPTPKKLADFFIGVLRDTIDFREKNGVKRNDFLQLLMMLMSKGYVEDMDSLDKTTNMKDQKFTFEEAAPEAFVFFVGGFETSSTMMQFILYELALNQDIQTRLREEITQVLTESNGEITYEGIHKMDYLGRVIAETLRKHPAATFLNRECTKPYKIPGTEIVLEKGTIVIVPNYGFQMDERYFPEPERFDPDRFLEEAKSTRNHYSYLPFGEGPRVCIGQRFAMMQMRAALVTMIANFRVNVAEGQTPIPIQYDPKLFILSSKGGMHLKISPL